MTAPSPLSRSGLPAVVGAALLLLGAAAGPSTLRAQDHPHAHADADTASTGFLPPHSREGSGTGWLPDATPVAAHHASLGGWDLMLHENVFLHYIDEAGERGGTHAGSINWLMGMASRPLGGGRFGVRGMISLEPLTVGKCGYPNLLQSGELCNGRPIVNGQHPHDLFMEAAAMWERPLGGSVGVQLYAGAVGEPALGPVAFPHRPSAMTFPIAPIGHHWHDASHISFGVATLGVYGRRWKLEGSAFNGREPDEDRYGFDFGPLDSWSGRITVLPAERWALQASFGHLESAHVHVGVPTPNVDRAPLAPADRLLRPAHPLVGGETAALDVQRVTASVIHHRPIGEAGHWATTLTWGRNMEEGHEETDAWLIESSLDLDGRHVLFARGEHVEKSDHDLAIPFPGHVDTYVETVFRLTKWTAGAMRTGPTLGALATGIGVGGSVTLLPEDLETFYGTESPYGFFAFLRFLPAAGEEGGHDHGH